MLGYQRVGCCYFLGATQGYRIRHEAIVSNRTRIEAAGRFKHC